MKSIDYLDGCRIYLLDLQNTDILDQKLSLEEINLGEKVGVLIFISLSERHHPLPEREEDYYIISFIAGFLLLKNDQEI